MSDTPTPPFLHKSEAFRWSLTISEWEEMIERGAMVLEQRLWASASFSHDMSEAVLRAALEVEHE